MKKYKEKKKEMEGKTVIRFEIIVTLSISFIKKKKGK